MYEHLVCMHLNIHVHEMPKEAKRGHCTARNWHCRGVSAAMRMLGTGPDLQKLQVLLTTEPSA